MDNAGKVTQEGLTVTWRLVIRCAHRSVMPEANCAYGSIKRWRYHCDFTGIAS